MKSLFDAFKGEGDDQRCRRPSEGRVFSSEGYYNASQGAGSRFSNLCCVQAAHPQSGWVSGRTTLFEALVIAVGTPFPYDGTVQRVRGCSRQMSVLVALDPDDVLF
jgi:hypothetical protein